LVSQSVSQSVSHRNSALLTGEEEREKFL